MKRKETIIINYQSIMINFPDNYSIYLLNIATGSNISLSIFFLEGIVVSVESYWYSSTVIVIDSSCYNTKCLHKVNDSTQVVI